jgi:hypothetical protein
MQAHYCEDERRLRLLPSRQRTRNDSGSLTLELGWGLERWGQFRGVRCFTCVASELTRMFISALHSPLLCVVQPASVSP